MQNFFLYPLDIQAWPGPFTVKKHVDKECIHHAEGMDN